MALPNEVSPLLQGAAANQGGYEIESSLRFREGQYLTFTPSSGGDRETSTISMWVKRGRLSARDDNNYTLVSCNAGGSNYDEYGFTQNYGNTQSDECWMRIQGGYYVIPNNKFRDTGAWYHIVFAKDGSQSTSSNRLKMYINGEEATYRSTNYQPQSQEWGYLTGAFTHRIGTWDTTYQKFDGHIAEFHMVQGQQLQASDFGEYNAAGVWVPKEYTGSWGANGCYLDFSDPSDIGADRSGNGNDWTPTGFNLSSTTGSNAYQYDYRLDSPTYNGDTINSLVRSFTNQVDDGDLSTGGSSGQAYHPGTIRIPANSGKYYWEIHTNPGSGGVRGNNQFGIYSTTENLSDFMTSSSGSLSRGVFVNQGGQKYVFGTSTGSYTTSWNGDGGEFTVQAVYLDTDNGTVGFYDKNGVDKGNAATGLSGPYYTNCNSESGLAYININGPFVYTPKTGYDQRVNANTLESVTIKNGQDHFNTVLYTGNGSTQSITGVGFQPDFVWIKGRNNSDNHTLHNSVIGATKYLYSNSSAAEVTTSNSLTSFDSDGFSLGSAGITNRLNDTYVAWCWKAGGSASSNTNGSLTSSVSANQTAGFSVVTYTGNGTSGATVGHGLGTDPQMIWVKLREVASDTGNKSWANYFSAIGNTGCLHFDQNVGTDSGSSFWNNTSPTSTVFTIGNNFQVNNSGKTYVAYCFAEVEGYSKFGSYSGNGSSDGPFVYCGFRPAFIMTKNTVGSQDWQIRDDQRLGYNPTDRTLAPNDSRTENSASSSYEIDFLSNGFKIRGGLSAINGSGNKIVFAAFAKHPFGGSNVAPSTAR